MLLLLECEDKNKDSSSQFPECVGIRESFTPYHVITPYFVTLTGKDTLKVQMIFTDYSPTSLFSYTSWHMWIAKDSLTITTYYDGYCSQHYSTGKWYGDSGLKYYGQYASCSFEFEIFTCKLVTGTCLIMRSQIPDTLSYHFTGKKL
jgi:hypothetical protein